MNIRVLGVIFVILLFALASGFLSYSVSGGTSLKDAYSEGNIKVIQETVAGTVPHQILITNSGNEAIKVKKGDILASSVSTDLVIAEDKKISASSNDTVKAYSIEPTQRAVVNAKLLPVNSTYNALNQVLRNSDPSNLQSTLKTQLQIWIIMSGNNLNPYTGEPVATAETRNLSWSQFRQEISDAKNGLLTLFNVKEDQIKDLNQNQAQSNAGQVQTSINNILSWIESSLGI